MSLKADFGRTNEPRLSVRVGCVVRTEDRSPHHRVVAIGGVDSDGRPWRLSEAAAIAALDDDRASFYIERPKGRRVDLRVGQGLGKRYLKTEVDGDSPDALLELPDCIVTA